MPLTGRAVVFRKRLAYEMTSLDAAQLRDEGFFRSLFPPSGTWSWRCRGVSIGSVGYSREDDDEGPCGLRFSYRIERRGERREFDYSVKIVSTDCHFGGRRYWFVCPLVTDGCVCRRRCRILYLPDGSDYFGCRECHLLTYDSRQMHRVACYERYLKHRDFLKRMEKFKKPRGTKAWVRRWRRYEAATDGIHGILTL